jgi:hypothetical protein
MTQQELPLEVNNKNLIDKMFRHNKNVGYKLKDIRETLQTFKNYFDTNFEDCIKTSVSYCNNELILELVLNNKPDVVRLTQDYDTERFSYIYSVEGSVAEAVSGNLNELFPEVFNSV